MVHLLHRVHSVELRQFPICWGNRRSRNPPIRSRPGERNTPPKKHTLEVFEPVPENMSVLNYHHEKYFLSYERSIRARAKNSRLAGRSATRRT